MSLLLEDMPGLKLPDKLLPMISTSNAIVIGIGLLTLTFHLTLASRMLPSNSGDGSLPSLSAPDTPAEISIRIESVPKLIGGKLSPIGRAERSTG